MVKYRKFLLHLGTNRILIVIIAGILGFYLAFNAVRSVQDNQYGKRALAIANATAAIPEVAALLVQGDPTHKLALIGESIRKSTGATYVVIADKNGIRHSHPNPLLIGFRLDGQLFALQGKSYTTINNGTLGRSANGKTPIYDAQHRIVGMVSAGILQSTFAGENRYLKQIFWVYGMGIMLLGFLISEFLARKLKGRRLTLELEEITTKFQERDAMLHGIKEGVITLTNHRKITLINDEAKRLLGVDSSALGKQIEVIIPPGRLLDLLKGDILPGDDEIVLTDNFSLKISRRSVRQMGRDIGSVITLRDRTEHIGLMRELDSVKNLTDALRAQQHEYANRMHTLNGLLELKRYDEASDYLGEISLIDAILAESLSNTLANPTVTALLIAKVVIARERGLDLDIDAAISIDDLAIDQNALITVVGNLLDNAIDAATGSPRGQVEISFTAGLPGRKVIRVHDSGAGLPEEFPHIVFEDGYSTKTPRAEGHRGLGLAIVQRLVKQVQGVILAFNEEGATFLVDLPVVATPALAGEI
ncbi:MAG TPA: sensor histidine kinase [Candidatus Nanopelagicaceae bacterium]